MDTPIPPSFSVIVPTYGRPQALGHCLSALAAQCYPRARFQVVVVDDGSPEPMDPVVDPWRVRLDLVLLRQPNGGPAAARNRGIAAASGDFLAFTDDDCRPQSDWLESLAAAHARHPGCLLGGETVNGYPDNPYSEASQALQSWLYAYFAQTEAPWRFFASNNLSAPAERIRALGGFDTETLSYASEDRELCGRWIARGWGLTLVPEARVVHFHRLDALGFAAQHFAYGRGAHRLRLARRRQGLPALPGDRTWMLASLTRYPFAPPRRSRGLALASLAALTHVANAAGYWVERLSARGR